MVALHASSGFVACPLTHSATPSKLPSSFSCSHPRLHGQGQGAFLPSTPGIALVCHAKGGKGGGSKKGGAQKKAASVIPKPGSLSGGDAPAPPPAAPPYTQGDIILHSLEVIDSYFRAVGSPIFSEPVDVANAARSLWDAPFALLTHGTEEDPIYTYGNAKTLELFDIGWEGFLAMPSRLSAPSDSQAQGQRNELLKRATATGAQDISGVIRVNTKGRLFRVDNGVLWTLVATDGEVLGQAAVLRQWHFLDEEDKEGEGEKGAEALGQDSATSSAGSAREAEAEAAAAEAHDTLPPGAPAESDLPQEPAQGDISPGEALHPVPALPSP